ncbi:MAG: hypothetical protein Q4G26_08915 [Paracoccus sp. (in: a-proteobacteria)]|nr:hypothetical protein [Paracoccus sp. (in: a-proteobacteria)]
MSDFENLGVKSGVWSGLLRREAEPGPISLTHQGETLAEARVSQPEPGLWRVDVDLPAAAINEGVTSFALIEDHAGRGTMLGRLALAAGQALDYDLDAEIAQIRAELDLLKREFRRFATAVSQG